MAQFLKKIFGTRNDRLLKQYYKVVTKINALEPSLQALSDEALSQKTQEFRDRLNQGETLDQILPEAFAVMREASKRVLGMRHFDVQLIGGMVLHEGKISEMRTGEGKTLVSTLPAYLNALSGKGVHVVTVNDYLAKRDAEWMGRVHRFLGLSVGINLSQMSHQEKQQAYGSDITYGTNNEFGFDYLRDNMVGDVSERVQCGLNFAIVDEVDSILIDEARTPLIISGQAEDSTDLYIKINTLIPHLKAQNEEESEGDFFVDLKAHQVTLSEAGHEKAERLLIEMGLLSEGSSLYDPSNIILMHHVYAALRAQVLYHRDQHYVVQNNEIVIVDEFTGRMMPGRRWSEGIHQALEAKEGVSIQNESQTLASITFQNYFRLYGKLSGMTGTADTEAFEFQHIYGLETVIIPTHRPMVRQDRMDQIFRSAREKYQAIIKDIEDCHQRGQPVLVGTTSIESSELLSQVLQQKKLSHQVLNAKQHAREADIVAQAGRPGMITIATNMAGRGTDIVLGGNIEQDVAEIENNESLSEQQKNEQINQLKSRWQEVHDAVLTAGGLHIIGSERHESRRIDNQLRGRAGRQGDKGSTRFYLSLEDPLLKIFAADRVASIMDRLKMPEGEAIEHPWVTRAIENAQRKVEARNFDIRKQLLEYDDVANDQRKVIYLQRNEILETTDVSETITAMRESVLTEEFRRFVPEDMAEDQWDLDSLVRTLEQDYALACPISDWLKAEPDLSEDELLKRVTKDANQRYQAKFELVSPDALHAYERSILLHTIDKYWREHLAALDHLRQGIHLRGYAQKNPKQEYKREAFELFSLMLDGIKREVTQILCRVEVSMQSEVEKAVEEEAQASQLSNIQYHHADFDEALAGNDDEIQATSDDGQTYRRDLPKVGRNDPCPCGSGKKYKQCHGRLA
ncbi:MAG: preprotein translocase subunit SecA [Betaproteobacteria bacterium]|nr:preprotein translocase subunit SecA [Betaproteobacteria bacterium]MDE2055665.1 preprotein translocase subunit SecA [Betaproteobacteria bacterium]